MVDLRDSNPSGRDHNAGCYRYTKVKAAGPAK